MPTLNILEPSNFSISAGVLTISDNTLAPFVVDDNEGDTIFDGDFGAPDNGIDTDQFLGGTTTQVYLESKFDVTNEEGTWTLFVVEVDDPTSGGGTSGIPQGLIVSGGPGPIPTGDFTISNASNVVPGDSPTFDSLTTPCLVRGTMVQTTRGEIAVEDLETGDMVITRDHGAQPVRWIGSRSVMGLGDLAPIRIAKGAMGNTRDLLVSPNHRMVLEGRQMDVLFGSSETLVAASLLVNDTNIRPAPMASVEYFHILFDTHEVIFAEGAATESFHPAEGGLDTLSQATRDEILKLFPQLEADVTTYGPAARQVLTAAEYAAV